MHGLSGWPFRPEGRPGRAATRSCIIREQSRRRRHSRVSSESNDYGPFESEWCRFLSLRDPTGAAHAVGPPEFVSAWSRLVAAPVIIQPGGERYSTASLSDILRMIQQSKSEFFPYATVPNRNIGRQFSRPARRARFVHRNAGVDDA